MQDIYRITAADEITLAMYSLTHVGQLWGRDDITGRMDRNTDAWYPEGMAINHGPLIDKCKNLRQKLQGWCGTGVIVLGAFSQIMGVAKLSGLYKKLCRYSVDALIPGPPSFYTRRRDRIPVPASPWPVHDRVQKSLENGYSQQNIGKVLPCHEKANKD